jgi:hypothetical protein
MGRPNLGDLKIERNPCEMVEKDHFKTAWASCHIPTCRNTYSVVNTDDLNVKPTCHECRVRSKTQESEECMLCHNKYCSPGGSAMCAMNQQIKYCDADSVPEALLIAQKRGLFVCPRCVARPKDMIVEKDYTIKELIAQNPVLEQVLPYTPYKILIGEAPLWKKVNAVRENECDISNKRLRDPTEKQIINSAAVIKSCHQALLLNDASLTCSLCVSDAASLHLICGNNGCGYRACKSCIYEWYGLIRMGQIVIQSNCKCPFCKLQPKFEVIKKIGDITRIKGLRTTKTTKEIEWDPRTIYAACIRCMHLKPAFERACNDAANEVAANGANEVVAVSQYVCDPCRHKETMGASKDVVFKECPKCGVATEHGGGCHHMTCANSACGVHWCWVCRQYQYKNIPFTSGSIYDHMAKCGGIFPNAGPLIEDDEYEYDDDDF